MSNIKIEKYKKFSLNDVILYQEKTEMMTKSPPRRFHVNYRGACRLNRYRSISLESLSPTKQASWPCHHLSFLLIDGTVRLHLTIGVCIQVKPVVFQSVLPVGKKSDQCRILMTVEFYKICHRIKILLKFSFVNFGISLKSILNIRIFFHNMA